MTSRRQGEQRKTGDGAGRPAPSDLPPSEREEMAMAAAVRWLSARDRSRAEMLRRLRDRGFDPETATRVLDRLATAGIQDDRRFAEGFAAAAARSRGLSARAIQGELRSMGVEADLAGEASTMSPEEERSLAEAHARRRLARMGGLPEDVQARRLTAFLARRGYGSSTCREVVNALVGEAGGD